MSLSEAALAALVSGLLGSVHCAAMCGPIVVAGCSSERGGGGASARAAVGYFAGRLASYAMIGAVMGHLGQHAMCVLPVGVVQGAAIAVVALLSAARGIAILRGSSNGAGFVELRRKPKPRSAIVSAFASILPKRGLGLGAATGFMPCGALVPAWALAASTSSATSGAITMAAFAVASAPGLLAPLVGRGLLRRAAASLPERAHGVLWLVFAAYIALRPLIASAHHHAHEGPAPSAAGSAASPQGETQ